MLKLSDNEFKVSKINTKGFNKKWTTCMNKWGIVSKIESIRIEQKC